MNKTELMNDMNFRNKCCSYGLDWENFDIYNGVIILNSPKKNILVVLDEHYNTIAIYDKNDTASKSLTFEERLKKIKAVHEDTYNTYTKLPYPFQYFSLKQIVEIAKRVYIYEGNSGHSFDVIVNEELVEDKCDNVYVSLLLYIKFLGQQIEKYFMNLYQMKMMGFEYPDVCNYIKRLMYNINDCINTNIKKGNRPFPIDIIKYLGQDRKNIEKYTHVLYGIIDLLLQEKGVKIKSGIEYYKEIEMNQMDKINLSDISIRLLKILEVTEEELEARAQERKSTFEFRKINLQSWLLECIDKDKALVLKKSKNNSLN